MESFSTGSKYNVTPERHISRRITGITVHMR